MLNRILSSLWLLFICGSAFADTGFTKVDPVTGTYTSTSPIAVTATSYSTGYDIGGKKAWTNAARVYTNGLTIESVALGDRNSTGKNVNLIVFNANPTATTFVDNVALTINDADLSKIACVIPLTSHQSFVDNNVTYQGNIGCALNLGASGTTMYTTMIAAEAVTYGTANDLNLSITYFQD